MPCFIPAAIAKRMLFAYGSSSFASKMGALAGNHFLTVIEGQAQFEEMGRRVLSNGAKPTSFEAMG
jgi:hypothetical protein